MEKKPLTTQNVLSEMDLFAEIPTDEMPDSATLENRIENIPQLPDLNASVYYKLGMTLATLLQEVDYALSKDYSSAAELRRFHPSEFDKDVGHIAKRLMNLNIRLHQTNIEGIVDEVAEVRANLIQRYEYTDEYLDQVDGVKLISCISDWMGDVQDELRNREIIEISYDGILDLEHIVENPSEFFEEEVWGWLNSRTKNDFRESCMCIIHGISTASVMLSLRAVEDCLRVWYEHTTGREIEARTWGQVIGELEDKYDKEERPAVLSNLDYLKEKRDSVMHPVNSPDNRSAERMLIRIEAQYLTKH
ncbi:hypothetical protein HTG_18555, partial [Natrinema mahii]